MRGPRSREPDPAAVLAELAAVVLRLDDQRRIAAEAAARSRLNQTDVAHAGTAQLVTLTAAVQEAATARAVADRAARSAAADGDVSAAEYERTVAALDTSQHVLAGAADQVRDLVDAAVENTERAEQVLRRAREVLDAQLRDQVRLLRATEQTLRRAQIAAVRDRPGAGR